MLSQLTSAKVLLLVLPCIFFFGCSQAELTQEEEKPASQQLPERKSKTVTVEEFQAKDQKCPETPGKLDPNKVKTLKLDQQKTRVSGQLTADEALGYSFEGEKDQKLIYSTEDKFCMWIYTPDHELLEGVKLPTDGSYIVQISIPKGAKTFELALSLEQPKSSEPSPETNRDASRQTPNNTNSISKPKINGPSVNREQAIDNLADRIFYERHPELQGRKIQPHETALSQEWKQIRNCEAIADYIFYSRYPELQGRKIQPGETQLAREWLSIKRRVSGCN
jgi:hypothetical protein